MSGPSTTPPIGMGMVPNSGLPPPYPGFSPSHASQSPMMIPMASQSPMISHPSQSPMMASHSPMMSSHGPASVGSSHGLPASPGFFPPKPSPTGMQNPYQQAPVQVPLNSQPSQPMYSDFEEKERLRFQIELEFVQCLANPNYINFLAQRGYFKDRCFVNYLKYLHGYWTQPAYVKFLKYPLCLHFLEMLQHDTFRKEIVNSQCAKFIDDQTILQWQHYTRKRVRLIESASQSNTDNTQSQGLTSKPDEVISK